MKSGSSGTIKFKSVLQRQEIERFVNNRSQLTRIIKRRRGNRGNTQWNVDYIVSNQGNVYITTIKCYNTFFESVNHKDIQQLISECVKNCLKKYLEENLMNRKVVNEQQCGGCIVYRGKDKEHNTNQNVWVSDSEEYALYWARQEYNKNGIVSKYFLPNNVISDLCNSNAFEEIMNEYDAWQEIPDDSTVWENDEYAEYDIMHDLCFPSKKQIAILKGEGYKGLIFKYTDECYSILIFDGRNLKII